MLVMTVGKCLQLLCEKSIIENEKEMKKSIKYTKRVRKCTSRARTAKKVSAHEQKESFVEAIW